MLFWIFPAGLRCNVNLPFPLTLNKIHAGFSHQRGFTQQLAAADQVPDGDVEVRVAAAPVGDLSEGVSGQDVLGEMPPHID